MNSFDWLLLALFYCGVGNVLLARWLSRHALSHFVLRELMRDDPMKWGLTWFMCCVKWPFYLGDKK